MEDEPVIDLTALEGDLRRVRLATVRAEQAYAVARRLVFDVDAQSGDLSAAQRQALDDLRQAEDELDGARRAMHRAKTGAD